MCTCKKGEKIVVYCCNLNTCIRTKTGWWNPARHVVCTVVTQVQCSYRVIHTTSPNIGILFQATMWSRSIPSARRFSRQKVTDGKCNLWTWYTKYKMAESINNLYIQWKQIIPCDILETLHLLLFILQCYIFIKTFIFWNKGTKIQVGTSYLRIEF